MAILRFSLTYRTRRTDSQSATNVVQYLTREGRYAVFPEHDVRYLTRTSDETQGRGDLRHVEVGGMPTWAQGDAAVFFEAAYQYERVNGRYAAALQMALPRELSHDQHLALARDFMATHLHDKAYLWVKHEPLAKDGQPQPHIHILCSTRMEDGIARGSEQFFRRYNRDHPERGGAQKDPFWNERRGVGMLRESWALLTNFHLERAGVEARVDPRELAVQGIQRRPGDKWHRSTEPRERDQEQAAAAEWWRGKKRELGLTDDTLVLAVRAYARRGSPGHYPTQEELTHGLTQTTAELRTLDAQARILQRALAREGPARQGAWHRTRGAQEERVRGGGLRVKLTPEEEVGRGW